MGNDQVRFDTSINALGSFNIITPIRDIQNITDNVRDYEINYLKERGIGVSSLHKKYSINENLMGATISGSEIDVWKAPKAESYVLSLIHISEPTRQP